MTTLRAQNEKLKELVKEQIHKRQASGFVLLDHYYPADAESQIDDIFKIIKSEISSLSQGEEKEGGRETEFKKWADLEAKLNYPSDRGKRITFRLGLLHALKYYNIFDL